MTSASLFSSMIVSSKYNILLILMRPTLPSQNTLVTD